MTLQNLSADFLREAAKHFVCMTYKVKQTGQEQKLNYASCFVVEIENHWILLTAGHVIEGLKNIHQKGTELTDFVLHDKLAGNTYPLGVPYPFDYKNWIAIDDDEQGFDFAAAPIDELTMRNLEAGGIRPVNEAACGTEEFDAYEHWLIAGIPSETYAYIGEAHKLKLTLMPIQPTERPALAKPQKAYAKLITQPTLDRAVINDLDGMSGAPVYGLKRIDGELRYWLIGIQSSWISTSRVVGICSPLPVLSAIQTAIRTLRSQNGVS